MLEQKTHNQNEIVLDLPKILGYISNGESVPDVIMTDLNRSNTGFIARDASRHAKYKTGEGAFKPVLVIGRPSSGISIIIVNPCVYVLTIVAKFASNING